MNVSRIFKYLSLAVLIVVFSSVAVSATLETSNKEIPVVQRSDNSTIISEVSSNHSKDSTFGKHRNYLSKFKKEIKKLQTPL